MKYEFTNLKMYEDVSDEDYFSLPYLSWSKIQDKKRGFILKPNNSTNIGSECHKFILEGKGTPSYDVLNIIHNFYKSINFNFDTYDKEVVFTADLHEIESGKIIKCKAKIDMYSTKNIIDLKFTKMNINNDYFNNEGQIKWYMLMTGVVNGYIIKFNYVNNQIKVIEYTKPPIDEFIEPLELFR